MKLKILANVLKLPIDLKLVKIGAFLEESLLARLSLEVGLGKVIKSSSLWNVTKAGLEACDWIA